MKQPDFTLIFKETFGTKPRPVVYEIRPYASFLHDLAFVSGLIHDARIIPSKLIKTDSCITMPINRDCWELGYTEHAKSVELHMVNSEIRFDGVVSNDFHNIDSKSNEEYWIDFIWASEEFRFHSSDSFELTIGGNEWKIGIKLSKEDFKILLNDIETPYLYSEKNG